VQEREATAEARGLVTQANRDLQRDNLALAQSRASTTSANAANAADAAEALKKQQKLQQRLKRSVVQDSLPMICYLMSLLNMEWAL
jgi:hypothetical protein